MSDATSKPTIDLMELPQIAELTNAKDDRFSLIIRASETSVDVNGGHKKEELFCFEYPIFLKPKNDGALQDFLRANNIESAGKSTQPDGTIFITSITGITEMAMVSMGALYQFLLDKCGWKIDDNFCERIGRAINLHNNGDERVMKPVGQVMPPRSTPAQLLASDQPLTANMQTIHKMILNVLNPDTLAGMYCDDQLQMAFVWQTGIPFMFRGRAVAEEIAEIILVKPVVKAFREKVIAQNPITIEEFRACLDQIEEVSHFIGWVLKDGAKSMVEPLFLGKSTDAKISSIQPANNPTQANPAAQENHRTRTTNSATISKNLRPEALLATAAINKKTAILMRHGHYGMGEALTDTGREEVISVAKKLIALNFTPDCILHSPLPRAVNTAQEMVRAFSALGKKITQVKSHPRLSANLNSVTDAILELKNEKTVLLVCHDLDIKDAVGRLCRRPFINDLTFAEAVILTNELPAWSETLKNSNPAFRIHGHVVPDHIVIPPKAEITTTTTDPVDERDIVNGVLNQLSWTISIERGLRLAKAEIVTRDISRLNQKIKYAAGVGASAKLILPPRRYEISYHERVFPILQAKGVELKERPSPKFG